MFTVGEFARLGQVSKRLLRYYDEINLFRPDQTDPATGYRYYSAAQMAQLNRILALKELGLSLDQIRRLLADNISVDEMQGMLLLKKAEIERQMQAEMQRIRKIESRLLAVHSAESASPLNVVIKRIPAQPVLSTRTIVESFDAGLEIFRQIRTALPDRSRYGLCYCICHSDDLAEQDMDLELGCLLEMPGHSGLALRGGLHLRLGELPAVASMATIVVQGALETIHTGYAEIGLWAENNHYRLAGVPREVSLQLPTAADGRDLITEIQFPVEPLHRD